MMTPAEMEDAYAALIAADADRDAEALAKLGWQLYAELAEANARNDALRARLTAAAVALRPGAPAPSQGTPAGFPCPGCGSAGTVEECVFCAQLQDPGCGYGLEHMPSAPGQAGRWQCSACRATVADDLAAVGASA